jgi:hypothetical protein
MQNRGTAVFLCVLTALGFACVAGCGTANTPIQVGTSLSGNWSFAPGNYGVILNLGFTQGAYETVSAVARLNGVSCVSPATDILLTGSVGGDNQMMLVSTPFNGTTLTLQGQVTGDGKGIAGATWAFAGGNCNTLGKADVTATNYSNINGTYTGNFVDASNDQLAVSALLEQTTQPDLNGQFSLSGTASFPGNKCFAQLAHADHVAGHGQQPVDDLHGYRQRSGADCLGHLQRRGQPADHHELVDHRRRVQRGLGNGNAGRAATESLNQGCSSQVAGHRSQVAGCSVQRTDLGSVVAAA